MKQSIQLRLGQHLTMTPQLQQAIRLLQLSTLELQLEVQTVLDSNLMLEPDEGDSPSTEVVEAREQPGKNDDQSSAKHAPVTEHKCRPDADQDTGKCEDIGINLNQRQNFDDFVEEVLAPLSDSIA